MRFRKKTTFLHITGDLLTALREKLGVFGPFSFKLLLGLALGLGSMFLFAKLVEDLLFNDLLLFDRTATAVVRFYQSETLTAVMRGISWLGSPFILAVTGLGIMIFAWFARRHVWNTILVPLALGGGIILNEALKFLFHRQRPGLHRLAKVSGFSFPSGHAMMSLVFYGLLIYLIWVYVPRKAFKLVLTFFLAVLILSIGISRIYLGVHYPSDVIAGFAAGCFWLAACIMGLRGLRYHKQ